MIVTLSEPYPFGNALARWFYALLGELSRRQHEVRCLSNITNQGWARSAIEATRPFRIDLTLHQTSEQPSWLMRKWRTLRRPYSYALTDELRSSLEREIQKGYDVLHLEQLWAGYLAEGRRRTLVTVPYLASIDLLGSNQSPGFRPQFDRYLMVRSEGRLLRRLDTVTTLSSRLASSIKAINPKASVTVVPFALDLSLYRFIDKVVREPLIGFVGSMNWNPVRAAARRLITSIFPRIKKQVPGAKLLIAGWQARQVLADFVSQRDISIVENVPDPLPYLRKLAVLAYPLSRGSGAKVKVLEAMAWGVPVVTTTDGVEGLEVFDGQHCFVADEDGAFSERVVELLLNADLGQTMRYQARQMVEQSHSPTSAVDKLERVYRILD